MARTLLLVVVCAALVAAKGLTESEANERVAAQAAVLVQDLADPERALVASRALVQFGDDALPALEPLIRSDGSLQARGWAVVVLGEVGSDAARAVLAHTASDENAPALLRTWANAARLQNARSLDELLAMAALLETTAALERPFTSRAHELMGQELLSPELGLDRRAAKQHEIVVRLLKVGQSRPQLQRALFPVLRLFTVPTLPTLVDIALRGEPTTLRRLAAEHIVSIARRGSGESITAALEALEQTPFADAPPLASVDNPRAARERERTSYLHLDDGIASYAVLPRVRHDDGRVTSLLAFPTPPERRVVAAQAFDGLTAVAGLDGSAEEHARLLPTVSADAEVRVLGASLEAVRGWAEDNELALEERVLSAAKQFVDEGWTLVGVSAPSPAPALGFRFRTSEITVPPDLLAVSEEWERLYLFTSAPKAPAGKERSLMKRLSATELTTALDNPRAEVEAVRRMLAADANASQSGTLVLDEERSERTLLEITRRLGLGSADTTPLLPHPNEARAPAGPSLVLTVLEGDLSDQSAPAAASKASESAPDGSASSPLVRRFDDNRIFRLLQKIWNDDDDEHEPEPEPEPEQVPVPEPVDEKNSGEPSHGAAE